MTSDPADTPPSATSAVDDDLQDTVEGYQRFREQFEKDKAFYIALAAKKQRPRMLWIGCCDSRVVPSQITSAEPGELFEVRNIANCVPPQGSDDDSVGGAIEYALGHLGIDDIVICGHTGCGGLQALSEPIPPDREAHLGRWVEYTRPAHNLIRAARVPEAERMMETIKAHVQFQLDNLKTYPAVSDGLAAGKLAIHGWVYNMDKGEVLAYDPELGEWRDLIELVSG